MYLYMKITKPVRRSGFYGLIIFGLLMTAVQLMVFFGSPPTSATQVAISALVSYFLFAAVAIWLEQKRVYAATEIHS
jgi:hypothetical protein